MSKMIFLDNASTTQCYKILSETMDKFSTKEFYNPSAPYGLALECKNQIERSRTNLLDLIGATNSSLIFCGSATEANNLAINSGITKNKKIAISMGEHSSVYECAMAIKNKGVEVVEVPLTNDGLVDEEAFKELDFKNISFISIIHINNETGAVNDIKKLTKIAKEKNPRILFHSDGVQAFGKIDVDFDDLGVDYYSVSAHKIHGPKGIGALVHKKNAKILPLIFGGGQEGGFRSGTENVAGIVAFSEAATTKFKSLINDYKLLKIVKKNLEQDIKDCGLNIVSNSNDKGSPYILSLSIEGLRGEVLVHALEKHNIFIGTGSACSTKKIKNRILNAMDRTQKQVEGNIRISFSVREIELDTKHVAKILATEAKKLIK